MKHDFLFLVHIEEEFRQYFPKLFVQRVVKAARNAQYVVHFTANVGDGMISELKPFIGREVDWGWGHEPGMFEDDEEEEKFIIPSPSPHEWTWIPPFVRDLSPERVRVTLGGGYQGECLLNMETCLKELGIEYRKIPGYVYGA